MKTKYFIYTLFIGMLISCHQEYEHKTVICIPVYGQSLALGEEAVRITDFDSLANYADGRIVTERMDHQYGYFDNNTQKQWIKRMINYDKRSFELTIYSMAQMLCDSIGEDSLICIFPGGQGTTALKNLMKGTDPYNKFIDDIQSAYENAHDKGWEFIMPALCWMQGETDVVDYPNTDYRSMILQMIKDISHDVKQITGQEKDVEFISYQTNPVTSAAHFNSLAFDCSESQVPQTLMELVRDNQKFHASSPTYQYNFARERIHIDAMGQKMHGKYVAMSALDIIRHRNRQRGLLPLSTQCIDNNVVVTFNVPYPPLVFDTISVAKTENYGFSVISPSNENILQSVQIQGNCIKLSCTQKANGCKVRYAINGTKMLSGRIHGPRGNLRDSQGLYIKTTINKKIIPLNNWCWQFDIPI